MRRYALALAALVSAAACGQTEPLMEPSTEPAASDVEALTPKQRAAYEQCLEDNMAVAMAWEIIEQRCLEEATGESDPLGLRPQ